MDTSGTPEHDAPALDPSSAEQATREGTGEWRGAGAQQLPTDTSDDSAGSADGDAAAPLNTGAAGDPTAEKDPDEWVTGDEPATGAQISYLETLSRELGRTVPGRLSKAGASRLIDELKTASTQRP